MKPHTHRNDDVCLMALQQRLQKTLKARRV